MANSPSCSEMLADSVVALEGLVKRLGYAVLGCVADDDGARSGLAHELLSAVQAATTAIDQTATESYAEAGDQLR
jgi:hypothetical protein